MAKFGAMKLLKRYIGAALAVLALASCVRDPRPDGPETAPGDLLPEFSVTMDDGSVLSTSALEGSVSVLVFFHTGCPDCREELPVVQRVYEEFGARIVLACISREQGAAEIEAYWRENGLSLPYSAQEDRAVYSLFAYSGVPRVYVSGPDLRVFSVYDDDPVAAYDDLSGDIRTLLETAGL